MPGPRGKVIWVVSFTVVGLFLVGVAVLVIYLWQLPREAEPAVVENDLPTQVVSLPALPPSDYVGSAACTVCHTKLCESFAQHPMGKSSALTPGPTDMEDFSPSKAEFLHHKDRRFRVHRDKKQIIHSEQLLDDNEQIVAQTSVPVTLAMGSGTRGKSYGFNRDGYIYQSPISWFSNHGGHWDLSPGYEFRVNHFERAWGETCLACHVGRISVDRKNPDRLTPPYFHEIAIGCENCHGPGAEHVKRQQSATAESPDTSIVNPVRLAPRLRDSVCYQCHLHGAFRTLRHGRNWTDYRPGMALEEIVCVFVESGPKTRGSGADAVSQADQMLLSKCYQASEGKLGCLSCHDPHRRPSDEEKHAFFRSRCNGCHADRGCALPENKRVLEDNSCITCHMPRFEAADIVHASQTNHRIPRDPGQIELESSNANPTGLAFFDGADQRMPDWEARRAKGIALLEHRQLTMDDDRVRTGVAMLQPLVKFLPNDDRLLVTLAQGHVALHEYKEARSCLEAAVALMPANDVYRERLAVVCMAAGDAQAAFVQLEDAVRLNPWKASTFSFQADVLTKLGKPQEAAKALRRCRALDPLNPALRKSP